LNVSGQVTVSPLVSNDPCKGPFNDLPLITVWEKKWTQSEWNPSTDPQDKIYADSWGNFFHHFELYKVATSANSVCNRSVKLKIAYDWEVRHFETESGEIDCNTPTNPSPVPQVTLPVSCNPLEEDPLPDRGPNGKFGGGGGPNRDIGGPVISPF
jgi:hypothetical protein